MNYKILKNYMYCFNQGISFSLFFLRKKSKNKFIVVYLLMESWIYYSSMMELSLVLTSDNLSDRKIIFHLILFRDHSFSTYAKFSEKLTFLTP